MLDSFFSTARGLTSNILRADGGVGGEGGAPHLQNSKLGRKIEAAIAETSHPVQVLTGGACTHLYLQQMRRMLGVKQPPHRLR